MSVSVSYHTAAGQGPVRIALPGRRPAAVTSLPTNRRPALRRPRLGRFAGGCGGWQGRRHGDGAEQDQSSQESSAESTTNGHRIIDSQNAGQHGVGDRAAQLRHHRRLTPRQSSVLHHRPPDRDRDQDNRQHR